jgi:hypothetical protein
LNRSTAIALTKKALRTVAAAKEKFGHDWWTKEPVPPDQYASMRNYLKKAEPLIRDLKLLYNRSIEPDFMHFMPDSDKKKVLAAIKLLEKTIIPIALIKKGEEDMPLLDLL